MTDLDLDATLALIPRPGGDAGSAAFSGGDFADTVDPYLSARLRELPPWATSPDPPAAVLAASKALDAACDRLDQAVELMQQLEADEADETRRRENAVEAAVLAGKAPTVKPAADWAVERQVRLVRHRVAAQQGVAAQAAQHAALREALPAWRAALVGQLADRHAAARQAVSAGVAAYEEWRALVAGATALHEAATGGHVTPLPQRVGITVAAANQGVRAVESLLADDHPGVSGAWLADDSRLTPSRIEREAMFEREAGVLALLEIEAAEGFKHTKFTMRLAHAQGRAEALMLDQAAAEVGSWAPTW